MKVQEIKTARQALEAAEPAERAWAEKLLRRFPAVQPRQERLPVMQYSVR